MRHLAFAASLCLAVSTAMPAQAPKELVGTLERQAVPGDLGTSIAISPAADDARARLGTVAAVGEKVWVGDLSVGGGKRSIYVLQSADGGLSVAADLDGSGTIEAKERITMTALTSSGPKPPSGPPMLVATLRFATPGSVFADFPVRVGFSNTWLSQATGGQGSATPRVYLRTSYQAFAVGSVVIDGKPTKVQLIVSAKNFAVNPSKSYQYVDCNGDGELDTDMTSWEMGYGSGAPVVFHIGTGDRYVSIKSIDVAKGTITLLARTAADYERIELRVGSTLPDFSFKTLDGANRRLSDFKGKYLIIDFWGTWCGPCVGEIPYLKKAYETYKDKGLEILGMDFEQPDVTPEDFAKGLEGVKKFVAEKGVTWTQAQTESIKPLYEKRFQVVAWPTIILVDSTGAIMSVDRTDKGEPGLRGEALDKTLRAIFSKSAQGPLVSMIVPGGEAMKYWSRWRGPSGQGLVDGGNYPDKWSDTENVIWKVAVPGRGHSSPIVWADRILLTTAAEDGSTRSILCFRRSDGKQLWQTAVPSAPAEALYAKNSYASASVSTDGERVYAYFGNAGLMAVDMDGKPVWHVGFGTLQLYHGPGGSPLLYKDRIILFQEQRLMDRSIPTDPGFIVAIDKETGKQLWRRERTPQPGWGTPIAIQVGDHVEIIVSSSRKIEAYNPDTGDVLWTCLGNTVEVIPTPAVGHGLLFVTSGRAGPTLAVRPGGTGDVTATHVAWSTPKGSPFVPSPLVFGDYLYTINDMASIASCFNAQTGELVGQERLGEARSEGFSASPVAVGGKVFFTNDDGETFVLSPAPEFKLLHVNRIGEQTLASPALVDGRWYIRTASHLWAIGKK
jgi:outer membrane protein assembly factor BamB/peroxiredoxin